MSYAIIRNSNYKKDNLAGLYKHNERKNTNYSNKDIHKDISHKNYSIKHCPTTYSNRLKQLIKEFDLKGRIISTTNVMCEFVITSDKEFFENIGEQETKRYFETAYNFVADYNNLGEDFIISAKIHLDETTPHMHITFVPVVHTKDKQGNQIYKIACSEYWKGKDSYKKLQDNYYSYMTRAGFELERGKTNNIEHLSIEKFKQVTEYDNIKYELERNDLDIPKKLENENKELILAQNKELVQYCKKLKYRLSKSFNAITRCIELETENKHLKKKVSTLEKEKTKLETYIENTFEVVKVLFDFPIKRLKKMIDSFIKSKDIEIDEEIEHIIDEDIKIR